MEVAQALGRALAALITSAEPRDSLLRLREMAKLLLNLFGFLGVELVVLGEEKIPIFSGSHGLVDKFLDPGSLPLQRLDISEGSNWVDLGLVIVESSATIRCYVLPISGGTDNCLLGVLFGYLPGKARISDVALQELKQNSHLLAVALHSIRSLHEFAQKTLTQAGAREQHRRLLDFFAGLCIAYFRADYNGTTTESTELDSIITGYTPEELASMPRQRLYDDSKSRERLIEKARKNNGQVAQQVVQMRRKDGAPFWAEGDLRILKDSLGCEIGCEGFYRDVTDRIRLQRYLDNDQERLFSEDELFTRLKQDAEFHLDYLSSVGHQLQTPPSAH